MLVNSLVGFKCSVHVQDSVGGYLFTAIYILVFGVVVYAITIGFPIRALFYIKKNNITGDKGSQKALVRFSLFLLIGNTISFIGHVVPIIASAAPESKNMQESEIIFGIVEGYFVYVSLLITPILIVLSFPVEISLFIHSFIQNVGSMYVHACVIILSIYLQIANLNQNGQMYICLLYTSDAADE